jgi:hypothetical protein
VSGRWHLRFKPPHKVGAGRVRANLPDGDSLTLRGVASLKVVGKEDLLEAPLSAQNEKGHRGVLLENLT